MAAESRSREARDLGPAHGGGSPRHWSPRCDGRRLRHHGREACRRERRDRAPRQYDPDRSHPLALGPISGAHFNPAVSLVMAVNGGLRWREFGPYVVAQIVGGCLGTLAAHCMFELPLLQLATKARTGPAQWFAEFVATFGLLVTILAVVRYRIEAVPFAVGLYITAAYWFTASTSFANPAVTIARSLTDTFAGISPSDAPMFILAQVAGSLTGMALMAWLLEPESE